MFCVFLKATKSISMIRSVNLNIFLLPLAANILQRIFLWGVFFFFSFFFSFGIKNLKGILCKNDTVTGMTRMSSTEEAKQKPFMSFGFSAEAGATKPPTVASGGAGDPSRREPTHVPSVNVAPTPAVHDMTSDTPEIRKYKKRFNSEILCAALWGVSLLIGK